MSTHTGQHAHEHDDALDAEIVEALACYGLRSTATPMRLAGGTLNRNYLVPTATGTKVLRRIRDDQPDAKLLAEHETIAWLQARGAPVVVPIAPTPIAILPSSPASWVQLGGRWVLFDYIHGRVPPRHRLSAGEAAVLGDIHGRLHALLADHPRSIDARFTMRWSAVQSLQLLHQVHEAARLANAPDEHLEGIQLQRRLLGALDVREPDAFAHLPCQWLHGDFHNDQVLLDDHDAVVAVLDWELCQSGPRVWELVRSLAFCGLLEQAALEDYLHAYGKHIALSNDEVAAGMRLWWQSRIVGVWVWWAAYVERNARVLEFVPSTIGTLQDLATPGWSERINARVVRLTQRV